MVITFSLENFVPIWSLENFIAMQLIFTILGN